MARTDTWGNHKTRITDKTWITDKTRISDKTGISHRIFNQARV